MQVARESLRNFSENPLNFPFGDGVGHCGIMWESLESAAENKKSMRNLICGEIRRAIFRSSPRIIQKISESLGEIEGTEFKKTSKNLKKISKSA